MKSQRKILSEFLAFVREQEDGGESVWSDEQLIDFFLSDKARKILHRVM